MDALLQVVNFGVQGLFFLLELLLNLKYFDIDHLVLLYFGYELLLSQREVLVDLFELVFHLLDLLRVVSGEETATEIGSVLLLIHTLLLPLILQFLKDANPLCEALVVQLKLFNLLYFHLQLDLVLLNVCG